MRCNWWHSTRTIYYTFNKAKNSLSLRCKRIWSSCIWFMLIQKLIFAIPNTHTPKMGIIVIGNRLDIKYSECVSISMSWFNFDAIELFLSIYTFIYELVVVVFFGSMRTSIKCKTVHSTNSERRQAATLQQHCNSNSSSSNINVVSIIWFVVWNSVMEPQFKTLTDEINETKQKKWKIDVERKYIYTHEALTQSTTPYTLSCWLALDGFSLSAAVEISFNQTKKEPTTTTPQLTHTAQHSPTTTFKSRKHLAK